MKVTTMGRKGNGASGGWSLASGCAGWRLSQWGLQHARRPPREQRTSKLVEIGQGKHGLRPRQVLGQAAVSHFGEAPQLLDYAKGVFAARPGPRTRPVDHPP